jgi:hypothetical protein
MTPSDATRSSFVVIRPSRIRRRCFGAWEWEANSGWTTGEAWTRRSALRAVRKVDKRIARSEAEWEVVE